MTSKIRERQTQFLRVNVKSILPSFRKGPGLPLPLLQRIDRSVRGPI